MAHDRTPIIGFIGRRGSGKTLLMSIFAIIAQKHGDTIFANYGLNIPFQKMDKHFLKSFFDTKGEAFLRGKDGTICIDELTTFLDAYEFRSKAAQVFSIFVLQTRKRGVSLFYTAQQVNLIPIRIRNNTDMLIHPTVDKDTDSLTYTVFDYMPPRVKKRKQITIPNISRFYHLYDSDEMIDILEKE